jgi:predicted ATP-dependent serine protease
MKIKLSSTDSSNFVRVSDIQIPEIYNRRFKCGKADLDAVWGDNGFLPGMSFTLAAGAGTGKTTMLIQMLELLEGQKKNCAYISAEESVHQLAFTCKRLGVNKVKVANMSVIEDIFDAVEKNNFDMIILDSLPALTCRKNLRGKKLEEYLSNYIVSKAKELECVVGIILHMTKTGQYKGSTLLPHSVDCNVIMSRNVEDPTVREIEVTKNRFGGCYGMAFAMSERGFNFEKVEIESEGNEKKPSKSDKYKQQIVDAIKEKGSINLATATAILGDLSRAMTVTRELALVGTIKKTGRGQKATFTI